MTSTSTPTINASSMADIGFLLLIFFLVTTTMEVDKGIQKTLPDKYATGTKQSTERNTLEIIINRKNEIMVNGVTITQLEDLEKLTIAFIDNGAGTDADGNPCHWCEGAKDVTSSEHPSKAVIKLLASRESNYEVYISVQNTIMGAYNSLRDRLAKSLYQDSFSNLTLSFKKNQTDDILESYIHTIKSKYPVQVFETTYQNVTQ